MVMKLHGSHLALTFLAIGFAGPVAAAPIPVRLADGATWTLTSHHSRTWHPSSASQPDFAAAIAKRLTWHGGKVPSLLVSPLPAPGGSIPPGIEASQTLDVPVLVQVDAALRPLGFVHPGEVLVATEQFIIRLAGTQDLEGAKKLLPDVLDVTAKALALMELGLLGRAQGLDLVPGRVVSTTTEYPNPFGGKGIPCQESLELESSSAATGRAVVVWRQTSDLSSVRDSVETLARRDGPMPAPGSSPGRRGMEQPEMTARCRYVIDIETGLAIEAQCTTEFLIELTRGPQRVVDKWSIAQTPPLPTRSGGSGRK